MQRFGPPKQGDESKVSGEYVFQDDQGHVFTLYDWKCTSLWEVAEGYVQEGEAPSFPTPEEFWSFDIPLPLNIGGTEDGNLQEFIQWLASEVAA